MNEEKISIRFFDNSEVRAIWDEKNSKWWFSVLDIVAVLTDQNDYSKTRNYWKYLKSKLKKENSQVVSATTQLKILAPDGKKRLYDMLDYNGIIALGKEFPSKKANRFIEWFTYSDKSIDGKSKTKAYALFESSLDGHSLGGYWKHWFNDTANNDLENEYKRYGYVAFSRAKHLLILATPQLNRVDKEYFENIGFKIENLKKRALF